MLIRSFLVENRNCKKTGVLLQALHRQKKPISYFALDVAAEPLIHSLSQMIGLLGDSQYISCQGLLGSYENCMMLLEEEDEAQRLFQRHHQHHQHQPLLFLWLGNSITNMPWEASVDSLHRLLRCPRSKLLASIDGNQDTDAIYMAYDPPEGELRRFVRNGLYHANRLLGEDVFEGTDWDYEGVWDPVTTEHRLYHVAKRDLLLTVDGHVVAFSKGQRLHAVTSAKWTASRVQELCAAADVVVKSTWVESVHKFGEYIPVVEHPTSALVVVLLTHPRLLLVKPEIER